MGKKKIKYIRNGKFTPNKVLPHIAPDNSLTKKYLGDDGQLHKIKMWSSRYQCFLESGLTCIKCGIEGIFFAMEKDCKCTVYHFNLYALDKDGDEVLMTKDHIIPKSRGGKNNISNYQTMCYPCNHAKGNQMPKLCLKLKRVVEKGCRKIKCLETKGGTNEC
jgi:5-methylcytosine-specific restriction endonuclease McrA